MNMFMLFCAICLILIFVLDYLLVGRYLLKENPIAFRRGMNYYGGIALVILLNSLLFNIL